MRGVSDRQPWWLRLLAMISTLVATILLVAIPAAATPATGVGVSVHPDELTALVEDGRSEVRPVLANGDPADRDLALRIELHREGDGCEITASPDTLSIAPYETKVQPIQLTATQECIGRKGVLIFPCQESPPRSSRCR